MINTLLYVALAIIALSVVLVLVRFLAGPGLANRMVAFDVMTIGTVGLIALYTALSERLIYLDVAIVYGVLSFIGVIVAARFIEKKL